MVTIKQNYRCVHACWYQENIVETVIFVLGKAVKMLLKALFLNARKKLQVNIDQKECIIQVKFGLNQ